MDKDLDGQLDPQSLATRFLTSGKQILKSILKALPAAAAWLIVALLRGQLYTCAVWKKNISCQHGENGTLVEYHVPACEVPNTEGETEFTNDKKGCIMTHARNIRSISHMIAWIYIVAVVVIGFIIYCISQTLSYFTYYQEKGVIFHLWGHITNQLELRKY